MTQDPAPIEQVDLDPSLDEFQDYDGPILPQGVGFDWSQLLTPASLRGMAAIVVSILVLRAPSQSAKGFALLLAAILIAWSVGGVAELRDPEKRSALGVARVAVLLILAGGLIFWPRFSAEQLGLLGGAALIAGGLFNGYRNFRSGEGGSRIEALLGSILYVTLGAALVVAPGAILGLAIVGLSFYWFVAGVLTLITNVRLDDRQIEPSGTFETFLEWIQTRPNTADDRVQLYAKLFYEGDLGPRRLSRFFTLMGFATAIAAFGVIADSTAVVIGAMLVAPLMTPLMGTSLAMVMGWPRRALMSGLVAIGGIAFTIGLSILFGWMYGPEISAVVNTQVASRIGPTLVDLAIAIAAGGAGAFALSRPDVSDSLPGVAVAIALVPPLAVVGLMISQNNWSAASGAILLFVTNLVAIILVGAGVFILTGVVPLLQLAQNSRWVKLSLGMVGVLAISVIAILGASADDFRRQTADTAAAERIVQDWLGDSELQLIDTEFSGEELFITLEGAEQPPPVEDLAADMEEEFDQSVNLSVKWVPTAVFEYQDDG